jgi:hypothetical protein
MHRTVCPLALLALLALTAAGCAPGSPEEQIAKIRAGYTVELNSWRALEPAAEEPAEAAEEAVAMAEAAATATEEGAAEEVMEEEMMAGPQPKNVLLDLVVYFRGRKSLKGITVDVTHADAAQQEKATYRQYVETAGMINGDTRQIDFLLEGLTVEEGDAFAVGLAEGIPADLGQYREFSEPAP